MKIRNLRAVAHFIMNFVLNEKPTASWKFLPLLALAMALSILSCPLRMSVILSVCLDYTPPVTVNIMLAIRREKYAPSADQIE